ncbi:MAG: tetratricopeptide repeat protein, partial [Bacteroidota bacterium]
MNPRFYLFILAFFLLPASGSGQDTKENADFKLAVNLYNDRMYDLALEQFRQFVATYPNTQQGTEARFYLGLSQLKLGKHDEARLTFQNFALAFPEHPKAPDAWWNVAEAYVALNNAREAALAFERVKTFHPRSKIAPNALVKSAEYFQLAGDRESAKKVLRTLIQDYSSSDVLLAVRLTLAQLYFSENQFELARAESKRVADGSKDPGTKAQAYVSLANALIRLGKYEDAQSALDEVTKGYRSTPSYYTALFSLGSLQRDLGSPSDALSSWTMIAKDSVQAPPDIRQQALIQMGDVYFLRRDFPNALSSYETGAGIKEGWRGEAVYKAAVSAEKTGAFSKSSALFRRALDDSVTKVDQRVLLLGAARAAAEARNFNDAIKLYTMFRDRFPEDINVPKALFEAGKVYENQLKDPRLAMSLFESVVRDFPTSSYVDDALFGYAEGLRQSGSLELASQTFETLQQRFPASEYAGLAREAATRIRLFELKNKETGLEKLALLIGDVIAQEPKGDLAFRLAEIYFHELKDYGRAAAQYSAALQAKFPPSRQAAAWYYQAKAYEHLAARQRLERGGAKNEALAQAIAGYDSLLRRFPSSEIADDAMISSLRLKLQRAATLSEIRMIGVEFLKAYPTARRKDLVHYALAEAYRAAKAFEDAAMTYEWALKSQPSGEIAPDALYRLGESLIALGARDTAAIVLEDYLARYPNREWSAKAAWTLAQYYASKGNAVQAVKLYQAIEQSYFYSELNRNLNVARGDAYVQAGDISSAVQSYQAYLRAVGDDVAARAEVPMKLLLNLASAYHRLDARSEAKRFYAEYLIRDESSDQAGQVYYWLGTIARDENNVSLAARYLQNASRLSSGSSGGFNRAALETAELYFTHEDYANAIASFSELAQQAKVDSLQQYLQSRIVVSYFRLNNTKEADARAAAFIKRFPGLSRHAAEFEYERGMYFLRKEDPVNAKRYFDNVLQKYASTTFVSQALMGNARVAELSEKPQDAIKLYESILQRYPNDKIAPRVQLSLGNLYYSQEKWDAAARQFKAIVDNESRAPDLLQYAMNNLILAYKKLSLFDGALELTRKYTERFPNDPELMNKRIDIGVLYQRLGYYDQSALHLKSLLENADADVEAEVRYYIGEAYFYKGDYQQAILEFLKVPYLVTKRTKNDWVATSYYMAGQSYEKMSKFDQAITMYKQIMERPGIDATFKAGAQREIDRG